MDDFFKKEDDDQEQQSFQMKSSSDWATGSKLAKQTSDWATGSNSNLDPRKALMDDILGGDPRRPSVNRKSTDNSRSSNNNKHRDSQDDGKFPKIPKDMLLLTQNRDVMLSTMIND